MKKTLFLLLLFFTNCRRWSEINIEYVTGNWSPDGSVYVIKEMETRWFEKNLFGVGFVGGNLTYELWRGKPPNWNWIKEGVIWNENYQVEKPEPIECISVSDYFIFFSKENQIYVYLRSEGKSYYLTSGSYPDYNPYLGELIFSRKGQGIFISESLTNYIKITNDGTTPVWEKEGYRIAYVKEGKDTVFVIDTLGKSIAKLTSPMPGPVAFPDWGPADSSAIIADFPAKDMSVIYYLDAFNWGDFITGIRYPKWSYDGAYLLNFKTLEVITRDGSQKWNLKP